MTNRVPRGVYTAIGLLIFIVMLFPVYWTIISALETQQQIFASPPTLYPPTPTLHAFADAFRTQGAHILTSLIVACGTVVLSLAIAAPAAYALALFRFRVTAAVVFGLLITQMIPSVILATPQRPLRLIS